MRDGQSFIDVQNLSRVFDISKPPLERILQNETRKMLKAVSEVSFSIKKGETFALVGESGSGKSTIARMITGLIPPSSGAISFDGVPIAGSPVKRVPSSVRRRFAMIFQDPYASLNPRWRVERIIAEPIIAFGLHRSKRDVRTHVEDLLQLVGLDPLDGAKYPHEFSGGQRQRIAIARALGANPEFIICDEPTSALDVSVQAQILNLMRDLQEKMNLTYLFISHNLAVVRHMANRIGVLYFGRLVEVSPAKELFKAPQHPYTRMLLSAIPDLGGRSHLSDMAKGEAANPVNVPSGCAYHPRCAYIFERCPIERPLLLPHFPPALCACHALQEKRLLPKALSMAI
jgi:peptide/nickel transport system ATP-binding protein